MDWEQRPIKEKVRAWFLGQIQDRVAFRQDECLYYLGLPADKAILEKELNQIYPNSFFHLFERDPEIYMKALSCLEESKISSNDFMVFNSDVDSYLDGLSQEGVSAFDVIWLDYCGPITPTRLQSVHKAVKGLSPNRVVGVTLMVGREKASGNAFYDTFGAGNETEISCDELTPVHFIRRAKALAEYVHSVNPNVSINILPYREKTSMMLIVFSCPQTKHSCVVVEPYLKE